MCGSNGAVAHRPPSPAGWTSWWAEGSTVGAPAGVGISAKAACGESGAGEASRGTYLASPTTSPTTTTAGACAPTRSASSARVATVAKVTRWSMRVARSTIAAG